MRPFVQSICLLMLLSIEARADFVLSFDGMAEVEANSTDETVDLYMTSNADVMIRSLGIRAFLGSTREMVIPPSGTVDASSLRGSEGNFQKAVFPGGVQVTGENYFWNGVNVTPYYPTTYGANVTHVEMMPSSERLLLANTPVKIATFHIDTTQFSGDALNISLDDPNGFFANQLTFATQIQGRDPLKPRTSALYTIGAGISIPNISSTPEPASIGIAGLGLTATLGWLRARNRRRKLARQSSPDDATAFV